MELSNSHDPNDNVSLESLINSFIRDPASNADMIIEKYYSMIGPIKVNLNLLFILIFGKFDFNKDYQSLVEQSEKNKGVCAKQLDENSIAWRCATCENDPNAIM